jgi:hypothetical protein
VSGTACVVEHQGKITAYATDVAFFAHAVAETNHGLKALIGAAPGFPGGGFLLPTRNGDVFRWCLENGLNPPVPIYRRCFIDEQTITGINKLPPPGPVH